MKIDLESVGEICVIAPYGRLDTASSTDFEIYIQGLISDSKSQFIIDFSNVSYVSSTGLRILLLLTKKLDSTQGSLKICALNEHVTHVFTVSGISTLFSIYPDRSTALEELSPIKPKVTQVSTLAAQLLGESSSTLPSQRPSSLGDHVSTLLGIERPKTKVTSQPIAKTNSPIGEHSMALEPLGTPHFIAEQSKGYGK